MNAPPLTWRQLAEQVPSLMDADLLDQQLKALHEREDKPWIVNFFSGVGAWFSALFMLPFLAIAGAFNSTPACAITGILFFGGAMVISRNSTHVFAGQLALGMLLAGDAMLLAAVAMLMELERYFFGLMTLTQLFLAILTCVFFRGATGRFLSLIAVPALASSWLVISEQPHGLHAIMAALAISTAILWTWQRRPEGLEVVAWAAVLSLPSVILLMDLLHGITWWRMPATPLWPSCVGMGVMLIWMVAHSHGGWAAASRPWFLGFALVVTIIAALGAAGVLVAMTLLYLARSQDEPVLSVVGHLFLAAFLVLFYYALNVSLAEKSLLVTGSGVLLLLGRQILSRYDKKPMEAVS